MIVREATTADIAFVCANLRAHNLAEFAALRFAGEDGPDALAAEIYQHREAGLEIKLYALAAENGAPVALAGAWTSGPRRAAVRLIATEQWLTVARPAYRWLKGTFIPCVLVPNVRVAESWVMDCGAESRAWLSRLGFPDVGRPLPFGKADEEFVHVAWINPDHMKCARS